MKQFDNYNSVLDFLYTQLPMFQRVGASAYKKDLSNTIKLCHALGNPEDRFKSIHIAGTNGKGSSSHYLAAILQSSGLKTGLYTSPHLKNFTERIKINGEEINQESVTAFVNKYYDAIMSIKPSFFEITVAIAFEYFANQEVDIAVIEVGMGGRLDSTNVITPEVSLITNISMDHQQWLGNTLNEIAREKAGIMKTGIPVVIGETQPELVEAFNDFASERNCEIYYASDHYHVTIDNGKVSIFRNQTEIFSFIDQYIGSYQKYNLASVMQVVEVLKNKGYKLELNQIIEGISHMKPITGLKGRWQVLSEKPYIICDVGHNEAGVGYIVDQLNNEKYDKLHIVWGTVNDKDVTSVLKLLPKTATYYFCQSNIPRAMEAEVLFEKAKQIGLSGHSYKTVEQALNAAKEAYEDRDLIFVGGSTFVVAELDI